MAEPDLIIEAGFSDAKLAAETQKVIQKYKQMGDAAEKAFKDASGAVTDNQALRAHMRELDKLQRAYDPVYTATQKYEAAVKKLDRALQVGAIDQGKYTAEIKRAQVELGRVSGVVGDDLPAKAGLARHELQGLGFQIQDFAVQVGAGTSATQAFAQQFPQAASMFGPWGAALGTAAAILVPLGAALLSTGDNAKVLDDQLDELAKSTDAMVSAAQAAATPLATLRASYRDLADEVASVNTAMATLTAISARQNLIGTANTAGGRFGNLSLPNVPVQFDGTQNLDRLRMAQREQQRAMDQLRRDTGATEEQMGRLVMAMRRMETSNSIEAVAKDAENLLSIIVELANNTNAPIEELSAWGAQISAIFQAAQRQIDAQKSAQQALIDTYDKNTQEMIRLADELGRAEAARLSASNAGKADEVAMWDRIIAKIRETIDETKALARESDAAFQEFARSVQKNLGGFLREGFTSVFGSSPEQFGQDAQAATRGIRELIKSRESGGNYNATLDNGAYTGGARDLVSMTINEVLEMQRQMLAHPANKKNSSAAGAYQIVRKTLQSLVDELGLTGNELYDPAMQDRLADQLLRRRRGQGIEGLRNEWEGLRHVNPAIIQQALGNQSIPLEDAQVASETKKRLDEENRERERKLKLVQQYSEQLSKNLVTEQQQAELERQRADAMARINADPSLSEADKAAAIAEVNAEMQRQLTIFALMEEAKRRGVDLDAQMVNSTMTYREAILALGDAQKSRAIAEQQAAASAQQLQEAQQFAAQQTQALKDGLVDAIVEGENFADVLASVAKALAKAALQAALFGEGPMSSGSGGGLLSGLFGGGGLLGGLFGGFRASGGPVSSGSAYLVGERGPEIIVPRSAGTVIPNHQLGGGGSVSVLVSVAPTGEFDARVERISGNVSRAHVASADRALPSRSAQISNDPLRR